MHITVKKRGYTPAKTSVYKVAWRAALRGLCATLCVVLCSMAATKAVAAEPKQYTINDVPNVRLSDARQYVSDPSRLLSTAACDSINSMLARLEKQTGIETAVVMLPSIGNDDIFNFAHELFRQWGIGKKKSDNGLLVLYVADQRKIRFTTGYGLEGTMTDAMSKRIQMQAMVPSFKEGDTDKGMVDGVRMIVRTLDKSMEPDADDDDADDAIVLLVIAIAIIITLAGIVIIGESQRCSKCRKKGVKRIKEETVRGANRRRIRRTTYRCPHCGHTFTRSENIDDEGSGGGFLFIPGGGGGGGGSFGGSFGGGSTGGGGSTSGW